MICFFLFVWYLKQICRLSHPCWILRHRKLYLYLIYSIYMLQFISAHTILDCRIYYPNSTVKYKRKPVCLIMFAWTNEGNYKKKRHLEYRITSQCLSLCDLLESTVRKEIPASVNSSQWDCDWRSFKRSDSDIFTNAVLRLNLKSGFQSYLSQHWFSMEYTIRYNLFSRNICMYIFSSKAIAIYN